MSIFRKAEKQKSKLRLALTGVAGSGKTLSALLLAKGLGGKIVMVDTERGSGDLYSSLDYDIFSFEPPYSPDRLVQVIKEAEKEGYDIIIFDSLSHFWSDEGGVLDIVDKTAAASQTKNKYIAWGKGTEVQNKLINTILGCKMHVIVTLRSKTAYELVDNNGKKSPQKIGLAPVQRDNLDYEFAVVLDLEKSTHLASVTGNGKDRTGIFENQVPFVITEDTGKNILNWLNSGAETVVPAEKLPDATDAAFDAAIARFARCKSVTDIDSVKKECLVPIWKKLNKEQRGSAEAAFKSRREEIVAEFKEDQPAGGEMPNSDTAKKIFLETAKVTALNATHGENWLKSVVKKHCASFDGDLEALHGMDDDVLQKVLSDVVTKKLNLEASK